MTEDEFLDKYKPQINHIVRNITSPVVADEDICSFGGKMYETFSPERDYVLTMVDQNRVVSIVEGDDEKGDDNEMHSTIFYCSGYHYINVLGYLITEKPLEEEFDIKLDW